MSKQDRRFGTAAAVLASDAPDTRGWERMVADLRDGLDPFPSSRTFEEPLSGLHTRELHGMDVFLSLFGPIAA